MLLISVIFTQRNSPLLLESGATFLETAATANSVSYQSSQHE